MKGQKTKFVIPIFLAVAILISVVVYSALFYEKGRDSIVTQRTESIRRGDEMTHDICLGDNERAEYEKIEKSEGRSIVNIIIRSRKADEKIFDFKIDNVLESYHIIEPHKCGVYTIREFNFDYKKYKPLPGFSTELWRYRYNGEGESILTLAGENELGKATLGFDYDFRINNDESYIALLKGYLGSADYALVIKDIKTKEDIFSLNLVDLMNQHSISPYPVSLDFWAENGEYFVASFFEPGAPLEEQTIAEIRIEIGTWDVKVTKMKE